MTGLGRAYSEATFSGIPGKKSHRHYTRHDVERACSSGPTDLLVVYESLDEPGIRNVIFATRPKLIVTTARANQKKYETIQGFPVVSLGRHETRMVTWEEGEFNIK